jgi:hypothetical protein
MDTERFDGLTRIVAQGISRRGLVAALGVLGIALPGMVEAKRKRKRKKKLKKNAFDCVNVGGKCRGKNANCCSGICEGMQPKKGKKDKSRCVGHDESTCQPGQIVIECSGAASVECITSTGSEGACSTTTGNAAYCLYGGDCFPCSRDSDCEAVCGPGAACIVCARLCEEETGGTACVGLSEESCTFPM